MFYSDNLNKSFNRALTTERKLGKRPLLSPSSFFTSLRSPKQMDSRLRSRNLCPLSSVGLGQTTTSSSPLLE